MNKPESLRQHLMQAVPELRKNPDRLHVFIDEGTMRSTAAPGLSFEYAYTLNLIFTDYSGHPDAIAVPLFAWLLVHQRELMENLDKAKDSVKFEADLLDNKKVDLSITLPLTERVIVKRLTNGTLTVDHPPEPQLDESYDAEHWQLFGNDELLAEWDNPSP
ncbi:phage tail protein [Pseudomonas jilinensis]|uniref:Phage tail protein n=1 Tax=Pseudomonas jilinensis TaxID=2078689 RepID=A0A396S1Z3_9PSED|nr:phage tail protein [Pseudomonas jilinensis]RHW21692.1 phage tail protein [Pseudomonas jilinensis]